MRKQEIFASAINIIEKEVSARRDGTVWVTDKIFYNTRDIVEQSRKNYLGVFEDPVNPITGQEKEWVPQTEIAIDNAVKSADIDTKDMNVYSPVSVSSNRLSSVVRAELKRSLYHINFGEKLNLGIRTLGIDGTLIWKTVEYKDTDGKYYPKVMPVNMLNFYIDPTADSIEEAIKNDGVIERSVISRSEFDSYTDWINKDKVQFKTSNDDKVEDLAPNDAGTTEYIEIFERWGIFPEYLITGKKDDKKYVFGRIICSGGEGKVVHLIEQLKEIKSPYEEAWFIRIPYVWRGRSIAEKLFDLQRSLNRTHNTRAVRSQIAQAGLWTIKRNKGINQENVSNLTTNGAMFVQDHEDVQQLQVKDVPVSSYKDEEVLSNWARQTTSAFESSTGETMASSMPATNAVIQKNAVQSTFDLIKEGIGMFLERWIKNQVFPIIQKNLTKGNIVRLTGDIVDLEEFDMELATKLAFQELSESWANWSMEEFEKKVQANIERLKSFGDSRFVELTKNVTISDYDIKVTFTDENNNIAIMTQRLVQMMSVAPEYRDKFVKEALDLMGIETGTLKPKATPEQQAEMVKAQGGAMPEQSAQEFSEANVPAYNVTE